MAPKFLKFLRRRKHAADSRAEEETLLDTIASDLVEKRQANEAQQERVEDAIRRGTRITKRRIPL
jgi:hypothetical protein